jgi:hypothetical protein
MEGSCNIKRGGERSLKKYLVKKKKLKWDGKELQCKER